MRAQAWAHMHTSKHNDSDGSHIAKGCSNCPQYFMNIPSIFYPILACSAFFLWKKVSFLSLSSQKIAGVRQYRQRSERRWKSEWSERGKKKSFEGFGERMDWWEMNSKGEAAAAVSDFRDKPHFSPWVTFRPVLRIFLCKVCLLKRRHCTPEGRKTKGGGCCHEW